MSAELPERLTARVLLIDPEKRILLIHYKNFQDEAGPSFWATLGGAVEPGESIEACARREVAEETGLTNIRLGPVVWYGEWTIPYGGAPRRFKETFILAHTDETTLSRAGWTPLERAMLIETRWWRIEELQAARETIYPIALPRLLPPLLEGRYPADIIRLREA